MEPDGPDNSHNSEQIDRSRPLVLIIEDDPDIGHLIARMLTPLRYDFLTTSTGVDGLRHAHRSHPDVITLDLALPDMDGAEVLARLKEAVATKDIPVIVVSIRGDEKLHQLAGAFAVMAKPVDRAELRAVVERAIASRQG